MNPFSLKGKTVLITGASSGIGAQCAIDCAAMGARVVLVARNEERLTSILSQLDGDGHGFVCYDLGQLAEQADASKSFITDLVKQYGKFDGFVHCAGIERTLPMKLTKATDYLDLYKVNAVSAFEIIRHLTNKVNFSSGGHIVLVSSITSIISRTGTAAYSASKGAMVSAMRAFVPELAKKQITINCISPGTILTPLMQNFLSTLSEEEYARRIGGFPLGIGETTDISNASVFLLSDASRWITGQNIVIDGGYTAL